VGSTFTYNISLCVGKGSSKLPMAEHGESLFLLGHVEVLNLLMLLRAPITISWFISG